MFDTVIDRFRNHVQARRARPPAIFDASATATVGASAAAIAAPRAATTTGASGAATAALVAVFVAVLAIAAARPAYAVSERELGDDEWARVKTLDRAEFLPALEPPFGPIGKGMSRIGAGEAELRYGGGLNMNRVDGISIVGIQELRNKPWLPGFRGYESYGFSSSKWSGALETRVYLGTRALSVAARWFDETTALPLPVQAIRPEENFGAALFLREDYMDYLRRRGGAAIAEVGRNPGRGLQLVYSRERHKSLERVRARIGPFGGAKRFLPNPEVDEGKWDVLRARAIWAFTAGESGWDDRDTHVFLADVQASGGSLEGPREFVRVWAEQRGRQRLTPSQFFGYRLAGGWTPTGSLVEGSSSRLPMQWQFQAGGLGTLRGHDYQSFRGDRIALATLEYGVVLNSQVRPVLFVDGGKAWNQADDQTGGIGGSGPVALDGGIGLQLGTGPTSARFDVARNLRAERAGAMVSFRLAVPY